MKKIKNHKDILEISSHCNDINKKLCFTIISLNIPIMRDYYYKAVKPTVESLGFTCETVDEQKFNGKIMEKIKNNIYAAKFIIFDATKARPNCYYELGIAHALNKDVIHISNNKKDIHFDISDFNFIHYDTIDNLASQLKERIMATIC